MESGAVRRRIVLRPQGVTVYRTLLDFAIPVSVLAAAGVLMPRLAESSANAAALTVPAVWFLLSTGALISLAFGRGRALFALLTLAAAYAGYRLFLQHGSPAALAYAVYAAMWLFVPVNLALLSLMRERGVANRHGAMRTAVLGVEIACAAWLALPGNAATVEWLYSPILGESKMGSTPIAHLGMIVMALCFAVCGAAWLKSRSAIDLGLLCGAVAFGLAAHNVTARGGFDIHLGAAALIVAIAVLQDTFRMAFLDQVTGLPSRRALEERLASLGREYAVAMIDVDRFKGLNDKYGHAIGDQVLRMIASKLARIGGGGSAYRYGGEEFTVLFPGRSVEEAIPHLEALREDIAAHRLALRSPERPSHSIPGKRRRGTGGDEDTVSVTISIGVAQPEDRLASAEDVIRAADQALYRAKNKGRNRLSR
jgi:diguanylate cyclase (GGDEF)-like protein